MLTELDNADKHRQLLVTLLANTGAGWFGPMEPVGWYNLRSHSELARFKLEPDEPGDRQDATFHFAVCLNEPALPAARRLRSAHEYLGMIRHHVVWKVLPAIRTLSV